MRRDILIHVALIGWAALVVLLAMPIIIMCLDQRYASPFYGAVWLTGTLVCLAAGGFIQLARKNKFRKAGQLFIVVAVLSLLGILVAYYKYGYDTGSGADPLDAIIDPGSSRR